MTDTDTAYDIACRFLDSGKLRNELEVAILRHMEHHIAVEREACAKICDEFDAINDEGHPVRPEGTVEGAETIARVIRART